uniref:Coat protein n=1 Tax=Podosphaera prunicola partitivirus 1 TaxID=2052567 RepID=A0A2P9JAN4_9VIRU|nr:coat protein [Podosphaera prunicola partitivirus 1]
MPKRSARKVDRESGMNRVSLPRRSRKPAPPPSSSSDEFLSSDSELESELDMPAKDDSRRKRKPPPPPARKGKKDGRTRDFKGEEDDHSDLDDQKKKESDSAVAPHRTILLAASYHIGISSISRSSVSSFVPSSANFFAMVSAICNVLVENTLIHELCPSFFTPAMFLYFGHVYYYQVLRARSAAGSDVLTRIERRALTYYERVGQPESWSIPGPLLGFLEYFAAHRTEDPFFGWIVPALPDFSALSSHSLRNLSAVPGAVRVPIIPAMHKFLSNFSIDTVFWDNEILYPTNPTLAADDTFLGLNASTAVSASFQALAFSAAWLCPCETNNNIGSYDLEIKRSRILRWNVPDVQEDANLSSLPAFLGFNDDSSFYWMKNLLSMAEVCCRFFPGSGTLSSVSPLTTLGVATRVAYNRTEPRLPRDSVWYHPRSGFSLKFKGYSNTENGLLDTKMSLTVSANACFSTNVIPAICGNSTAQEQGPFFVNDPLAANNFEFMAVPVTEGSSREDPAGNFKQLASRQYSNKAGK